MRIHNRKTRRRICRKSRTCRNRKGGSQEDLHWLRNTFKPRILAIFASGRPNNMAVIPFGKLFMVVSIDLYPDHTIREMEFAIKKDPYERPVKQNACWLGVAERKEPSGWSHYNKPTVNAKQLFPFTRESDLGFSLHCEAFGGSNLTYVLFYCWFYTLKLHAAHIKKPDYIITDYDIANPSGKRYGEEGYILYKDIVLQRLVGKSLEDLDIIMADPKYNLYYERFGFVYPEKREFFETFLRTGKGLVEEVNDEPMPIQRFYLDMSTLTLEGIEVLMEKVLLKV